MFQTFSCTYGYKERLAGLYQSVKPTRVQKKVQDFSPWCIMITEGIMPEFCAYLSKRRTPILPYQNMQPSEIFWFIPSMETYYLNSWKFHNLCKRTDDRKTYPFYHVDASFNAFHGDIPALLLMNYDKHDKLDVWLSHIFLLFKFQFVFYGQFDHF